MMIIYFKQQLRKAQRKKIKLTVKYFMFILENICRNIHAHSQALS